MKIRLGLLAAASLFAIACLAQQMAAGESTEHVVVYGTLPDSDIGQDAGKVPGELQSFSADQVTAQHGATVLDALGNQTAGVSLSDSQGNTMFQDLRFHGFEASPLQGVAQGVAVYQNGVRLNEAFGDTVNWDAIPETAIARMDVWSSNPVFGLNALGGSVNLVMKNGFTWQGTALSAPGRHLRPWHGHRAIWLRRRQSQLLWRGGRRDRQRLAAAFAVGPGTALYRCRLALSATANCILVASGVAVGTWAWWGRRPSSCCSRRRPVQPQQQAAGLCGGQSARRL